MHKLLFGTLFYLSVTYSANGCCFPKQSEGQIQLSGGTFSNGNGATVMGMMYYAKDSVRRLVRMSGKMYVNGHPTDIDTFYDFNEGKQYEAANGGCRVKRIDEFNPLLTRDCVPGNAARIYDSFYGAGDNKVDVEGFYYTEGDKRTTLTVEKGSCALMASSIQNDNMILNFGVIGVQLGFINSSLLEMPQACKYFYG